MWVTIIVFAFSLGLLAGYQLPIWLAAWHAYRHRKNFQMVYLKQYIPVTTRPVEEPPESRL